VLEWPEDSEFAGLEIRMKRLSVRQLMRIERLSEIRKSKDTDEVLAAWAELLDTLGKGLLGWNYEDDNGAVPAARESLDDLDLDMVLAWVRAWTRAATAVPLASPPSSPTGAPVPPDEEWASFLETSQESLPAPASS
jgi:hypothetical protein